MTAQAEMTTEASTFKPPANTIVWFEIPVTDMERAKNFYSQVLMGSFTGSTDGPNPMAFFDYDQAGGGVSGHLYPGKPAADGSGPTVHLAVPDDVKLAMERVAPAGGKVVSPIVEIPSGRFVYCLDPDGNSIGLFSV